MSHKPLLVVHVIHHLLIGGMENGMVNLINRLPHDRFRHVAICIEDSSEFARRIERADGLSAGRVRQIYNGVDTDCFVPTQPRPQTLLPAELLGDGLFIIGAVGRVRPIKDQATLLRAFARLLDRRPDWRARLRLALIGDGPQLPELQALAASLGISAQCWFSGARDDVAALMRSLDLFVLPSLNEGISNTLLEAMSTGLPVVATAVGGNVELMDEGSIGAYSSPGDYTYLAAIIESYAADSALRARHGAAARERAVNCFSLRAIVANYQDVYESL